MFNPQKARQWILQASELKQEISSLKTLIRTLIDATGAAPKDAWMNIDELRFEGEVCCLFADSNLSKFIYAVQMAESEKLFVSLTSAATSDYNR